MRAVVSVRPSYINAASTNMYITIWHTLGNMPKQRMIAKQSSINGDGPSLLWQLLRHFHGIAAQIIRQQRTCIDAFKTRLSLYDGNVSKFAEHIRKTVQTLKDAGGDDAQVFDKAYKALTETHLYPFNNEIRV